ncbi:hypothetical protein EVA_08628 [gut metagenome]|uniref:Uncharacterized protein n=1 Tax=gut metagenome TaxID=749906 RepID=J9GM20_9ZZZZ
MSALEQKIKGSTSRPSQQRPPQARAAPTDSENPLRRRCVTAVLLPAPLALLKRGWMPSPTPAMSGWMLPST